MILLMCIKSGGLQPPKLPALFFWAPAPQDLRLGGCRPPSHFAGVSEGGSHPTGGSGGREPPYKSREVLGAAARQTLCARARFPVTI